MGGGPPGSGPQALVRGDDAMSTCRKRGATRHGRCGPIVFAIVALVGLRCSGADAAAPSIPPTPQGHYIFRSYGPADGLVNTTVTRLLQDTQGLIWAGTNDGLYRYDGNRFDLFGTHHGLATAEIEALHEDRHGTLWVGTHAGVSRWNGVAFVPLVGMLGPDDHARGIADDAAGVWLATSKGLLLGASDREFRKVPGWQGGEATALLIGRTHAGVWAARWDGKPHVLRLKAGVWSEYAFGDEGSEDSIDALAEDGYGQLWARSAFRLWVLDEQRQRFEPVESPSPILSDPGYLTVGRDGGLWVSSSERLLHRVDGRWSESLGGAALGTRPVLEDREGSLWFGARGLQRMAGRGVFHTYDANEGLPGNVAWSVARGLDQTLWVGTEHGLARAVGEHFQTIPGTENFVVRTIVVAPDGKLFVAGVPGNAVLTIDPATHAVRRIALGAESQKQIYRLLLDAQGVLWATSNTGLLHADTHDAAPHFVRELLPGTGTDKLQRGIDIEANGRLWVAGESGLLLRENGQWRRFGLADGLRSDELECIRIMHNGDLLVAYAGTNGFDRMRYQSGRLLTLSQDKVGTTSYVDSVFTVGEDTQDNVWIGTGSGIDRYTPGGVEHFGAQQGLPGEDSASMAFLAQPDGDIWLGVVGGLVRFDAAKYRALPPPAPAPAELLDLRLGEQRFTPEAVDTRALHAANVFHARFASPTFVGEGIVQYRTLLHGLETQANVTENREANYAALPPGSYRFEVSARKGSSGDWGTPATFAFEVLPAWWQTWWMRALFALALICIALLALRWRVAALKQHNRGLEQGIATRTAELTRANHLLINEIGERLKAEAHVQQRNAELEELNQRLAGTQSQLLQSEKMASVGQLAAGVAHEINNPIGFVYSNLGSLKRYVGDIFAVLRASELLESTLSPGHPHLAELRALRQHVDLEFLRNDTDTLLAETLDGVTRVRKIVKDLKDFSHVDEAEWQRIDLHDSLDSTLNVVAHELKYKAHLVKEYATLPQIECLPFQINQVFVNLLVNAVQAIEGHGTITIRTGCDGDFVWASIADTGKGIDPTVLHRIFEPFFTTKPVGVGTGLGLSVSYGIIHTHGGSIEVQSALDCGTTFTVRLPIEPRHQTSPAAANEPHLRQAAAV